MASTPSAGPLPTYHGRALNSGFLWHKPALLLLCLGALWNSQDSKTGHLQLSVYLCVRIAFEPALHACCWLAQALQPRAFFVENSVAWLKLPTKYVKAHIHALDPETLH